MFHILVHFSAATDSKRSNTKFFEAFEESLHIGQSPETGGKAISLLASCPVFVVLERRLEYAVRFGIVLVGGYSPEQLVIIDKCSD